MNVDHSPVFKSTASSGRVKRFGHLPIVWSRTLSWGGKWCGCIKTNQTQPATRMQETNRTNVSENNIMCVQNCVIKKCFTAPVRVKIHTISHVLGWKHVQHDKNEHLHYKIVLGKMVPTHACQYSKPTSKNYFTSNDPRCDIILSQFLTSHLDVYMAYNFWYSNLAFLFWHSILTFYSVLASILIFCKWNGVRRAVFLNLGLEVIHKYCACHNWQCDLTCPYVVVVDAFHGPTLLDSCCVSSLCSSHAKLMELRSTDIKVLHSSLDWRVSTVQSTFFPIIFSSVLHVTHLPCKNWASGFGFTRQPISKLHPSFHKCHLTQLICVSLEPLGYQVFLVHPLSIRNSFKSVSQLLTQPNPWSLFHGEEPR